MSGFEGNVTNWDKIKTQQNDKFSLFVGNLDSMVNEELLSNFFQKWGRIFSVRIMRAKGKGTSRGFGFVTYY
jgi:RNA recognition motif-containing protein